MQIVVIAHNIRSTHNIGAILRSSDAFSVEKVYCTGYSPYPLIKKDQRLPHEITKLTKQIAKTALGAEKTVEILHHTDIHALISSLKHEGYLVIGLEQDKKSKPLKGYTPLHKLALLLGEEVKGITKDLLSECDEILEIPMNGKKESLNVSVAAGIALYQLSF